MTIAALPPAPDPGDDRATFNSKAFAFNQALADFVDEANATATDVNDDAAAAAASAAASLASKNAAQASESASASNASAAATSAGAIAWVSGTTYAIGDKRWSLLNGRVYVRLTSGAGTTDPQNDQTNWADVIGGRRIRITSNTNAVVGCLYELDSSAGSFTVTLPASFNNQDRIGFVDVGAALAAYPVTIARNGNNIRRAAEDLIADTNSDRFDLVGLTSLGWIEE